MMDSHTYFLVHWPNKSSVVIAYSKEISKIMDDYADAKVQEALSQHVKNAETNETEETN
jgi:hypothetical protein